MQNSHIHSEEISLFPFKKEFDGYTWGTFRKDAKAALSVALLTVPQAIAYALLAGLPLTAGLFAAIYSSIFAAAFGSSRHLVVGPSNAIAIMVQAGTAEILFTHYRDLDGPARDLAALQVLTQLALLVGLIQVLAGGCKLGKLTQFVSHSVTVGYITGTAMAVILNQLFTCLGVPNMVGDHSLYERGVYLISHLKECHLPTVWIGLGSVFMLVIFRSIDRRIPAPVITLALAAAAAHLLEFYSISGILTEGNAEISGEKVLVIGDHGAINDLIPEISLPYFDIGLLNYLLPVAFAVALLGIIETTSVAKTIATASGQRLSINQEIIGLGLGNLLSSFVTAMPISGSPSRTSLSFSLGSKTRAAAILNGLFVAIFLYSMSFLIMHIPLAALAALLLVTAWNIVQPRQFFLCLKATNSDAFVLWSTLLACIFLRLDIAFYIGVVLSITLYLKKAAAPELGEYEADEKGELHNLDFTHAHEHRTIRIIKVEGELFFGAADIFQTTLKTIAEDDTSTRVIILYLKNTRDIDATVCLALQQLHKYLKASGRHLIACGMTQQIWDVLSDSGLIEQIGKENLFVYDEKHSNQCIIKAMNHARWLMTKSEVSEQAVSSPAFGSTMPAQIAQ